MQIKRRDFFSFCLGLTLPTALVGTVNAKEKRSPTGGLSIMQGPTSDTQTQLAVVRAKNTPMFYFLIDGEYKIEPESSLTFERNDSDYVVDHILFSGLSPQRSYDLFAVQRDSNKVMDHRSLQTLDIYKAHFRAALISCSNDSFRLRSRQMCRALVKQNPEILLMLGDNVYAGLVVNRPPKTVWRRHVETRLRLLIFRAKKLIPMLATWDDHDVGGNNIDRTYEFMSGSLDIFHSFYPRFKLKNNFDTGPGVSSYFSAFGMQIFMLDGRSQRHEQKVPLHYLWGKEQYDWMVEKLSSNVVPTWVANGTQFFGRSYESVQHADPDTFSFFLNKLSQYASPVTFLSGDVHFSEVMELPKDLMGYTSYELTSSSFHSYAKPITSLPRNPYRLNGTRAFNFLVVDVDTTNNEFSYNIKSVLSEQRIAFELSIKSSVKE